MIDCFDGEFAFLSNFYEHPIFDGHLEMSTMEHYFQAHKTSNKYDYVVIAAAKTPGKAKRIGRRTELRSDWEQVKEQVTQTVDDAKQKAIVEAEAKAAQIIETAQNEANKLVDKASNPIAKIAAKAAADKLIAEAEKQAQKIIDEAKK